MILSADQILQADDLPKETVEVPEWGGDVIVRTLTGRERDRYEQSLFEIKGKQIQQNYENARAKLCALCMIDEEGKRLFSDAQVVELGNKSSAAIDRIYAVASRMNGFSKEDIDELVKN